MSRHIVGLLVLAIFVRACNGKSRGDPAPTRVVTPFVRSATQVPDPVSPRSSPNANSTPTTILTEPTSLVPASETALLTFSEYTIPTANVLPLSIALDANGVIWFTELNGNKLGSFDSQTRKFEENSIPTGNGGPHGVGVA